MSNKGKKVMNEIKNWKKLPIENLQLKEIVINGNGKDSTFEIETKNPTKILSFEMSDPILKVCIKAKVLTETFNYGDSDLGVKYIPLEDTKITQFEIDFLGDETDWENSMKSFENDEKDCFGWMFQNVKITLDSIS